MIRLELLLDLLFSKLKTAGGYGVHSKVRKPSRARAFAQDVRGIAAIFFSGQGCGSACGIDSVCSRPRTTSSRLISSTLASVNHGSAAAGFRTFLVL